MSRPMGFGPEQDPEDPDEDPTTPPGDANKGDGNKGDGGPADPLSALFAQLMGDGGGSMPAGFQLPPGFALPPGMELPAGGIDPQMLSQALGQAQRLLAGGGTGPVNWELATDTARQATADPDVPGGGDPTPGAAEQRAVTEALRLADLWLDGVTDLPAGATTVATWSRAEWVEHTLPTWRRLVEPVAASVADALAEAMSSQAPPEMRPMIASAGSMMKQLGGGVFGMQVGQAIGGLAQEVVSASDVGLPLAPGGTVALVPTNVAALGEGLGVPADEVRLYLALREAAHARLFAGVAWLGPHLLGAVESYARGISIDTERIEQALGSIDPIGDPESLQRALGEGLFEPQRSEAQQAALDRLETALALVEGWVDEVVDRAARPHLPAAGALRETMRRRRASGGPAEHAFGALVGLELRPRRLREAALLWNLVAENQGVAAREALWGHPDLLPDASALDDPAAWAQQRGAAQQNADAVDAALAELLQDPDDRPEE